MIERRRVVYFTPEDDAHAALMSAANAAKRSLHCLIYGFTLPDLADLLIAKLAAGLVVGVVVDRTQAAGKAQRPLLQYLVDAGVPVTISTSDVGGAILHDKVLLCDVAALGSLDSDSFAVYGSYNFSAGAGKQANVLITDNDPAICDRFYAQYLELEAYGKTHCVQLTPVAAHA